MCSPSWTTTLADNHLESAKQVDNHFPFGHEKGLSALGQERRILLDHAESVIGEKVVVSVRSGDNADMIMTGFGVDHNPVEFVELKFPFG